MKDANPRDTAAREVSKHIVPVIMSRLSDDDVSGIADAKRLVGEARENLRVCAGQIARRFFGNVPRQ